MKSTRHDRKVLHVTTVMWSGGVEKWLIDLAAATRSSGVSNSVLMQTKIEGMRAFQAQDLGIEVLEGVSGKNPIAFIRRLWQVLRDNGPFDAVHAHIHSYSGIVCLVAFLARVPTRIAHSHNDTSQDNFGIGRRAYRQVARWLINLFATAGFGAGVGATRDLFGAHFDRDQRWAVLPCGISLEPFTKPENREVIAQELGIPKDAFVLAQAGRLVDMKNQEFSIRLLATIEDQNCYLLLLGDGSNETRYRALAETLGVSRRVIFAGARLDVPRILSSCADVFLFPSTEGEGAPIALVEAQAAGLPCLVSEHVPPLSTVVSRLVTRIGLSSIDAWIQELNAIRGKPSTVAEKLEALEEVRASQFSIESNVNILAPLYLNNR